MGAKVHVERDARIPMRDGVELLADVWSPGPEQGAPLLLVRSPYGRRGAFAKAYGRWYARLGFRVVLQSCRGTAGSGGEFLPFVNEVADGQDTVAWLRTQPWFPGRFATVGGSYLGYVQLALAVDPPPELAGMVVQCAPTTVRSVVYPDGAYAPLTTLMWAMTTAGGPLDKARAMAMMVSGRARLVRPPSALEVVADYTSVTKRRIDYIDDWLSHADAADPFWEPLDLAAALRRIQVPVLIQAGWHDTFLDDSFDQFTALHERGVPVSLTVADATHADLGKSPGLGEQAAAFLRHVTGGGTETRLPAVQVEVVGTKGWAAFDSWPPPSRPVELELGPATTFSYHPSDPTPTRGGPLLMLGAGSKDQTRIEKRGDVVTLTGPALSEPLDVAGVPTVRLAASTDATHLLVRLCKVAVDGRSVNLVDRLTTPGGEVVRLPGLAVRLQPGERLKVQVSAGAYPRWAPGRPSTTTVTACRVTLPVVSEIGVEVLR